MNNDFSLELTMNEDLSNDLYKDSRSFEAFISWLCSVIKSAFAKQKLATTNLYLISLQEEVSFCLS
jgi:hypothetical protein